MNKLAFDHHVVDVLLVCSPCLLMCCAGALASKELLLLPTAHRGQASAAAILSLASAVCVSFVVVFFA